MDLSDISKFADEQDAGRWFELRNPVDGSGTGIKLLIVGPDSKRQRGISISLQKALLKAQDKRGQIDPIRSEEIFADHIAQFVIDLDATEDGQAVPYSHEAILGIVRNGRRWAAPQISKFAEARLPYQEVEA